MLTAANVPVALTKVVPSHEIKGASADAITIGVVVPPIGFTVLIEPVGQIPSESIAQPKSVFEMFLFSIL